MISSEELELELIVPVQLQFVVVVEDVIVRDAGGFVLEDKLELPESNCLGSSIILLLLGEVVVFTFPVCLDKIETICKYMKEKKVY